MMCVYCHFQELSYAYHILRLAALVFPNYCLGRGLMDLAFTEYSNAYYKLIGKSINEPFAALNFYKMSSIGLIFLL